MNKNVKKIIGVGCIVTLCLLTLMACRPRREQGNVSASNPASQTTTREKARETTRPTGNTKSNIGFRTRRNLEEHFQKHGQEFGDISMDEYLHRAQSLRDAAVGGDVLEAKRPDGITTRFDRASGEFIAFNEDLTIRTFFKPNDGERYFKRQINKEH